jgi:hypothetical protein
MTKYYAIVGETFVVPIQEISANNMDLIRSVPFTRTMQPASIPVYFASGMGVWPEAASDVVIAKVVNKSEI